MIIWIDQEYVIVIFVIYIQQESALEALFQAISLLLRGLCDRRTLLENLDYVVLVMDEVIDKGQVNYWTIILYGIFICYTWNFSVLLETDYEAIAERVSAEGTETPLAEQSFAQAFQSARLTLDTLLK